MLMGYLAFERHMWTAGFKFKNSKVIHVFSTYALPVCWVWHSASPRIHKSVQLNQGPHPQHTYNPEEWWKRK
jgi:hypothetical protein